MLGALQSVGGQDVAAHLAIIELEAHHLAACYIDQSYGVWLRVPRQLDVPSNTAQKRLGVLDAFGAEPSMTTEPARINRVATNS